MLKRAWVLLFLLLALPAAAQDRSAVWERWDTRIDQVDTEQNQFRVTETQVIRFDGTFRGGENQISDMNLQSIRVQGVWQDSRPMREATCTRADALLAPGTYCVYTDFYGALVLYEFFDQVNDSTETIRLEYMIDGALRVYDDGDQLWWIAIPDERPGAVEAATITLELPESFAPREGIDPVVTYGAAGDVRVNGRTVVAEATEPMPPGVTFELRAQYPHDRAARKPTWQVSFDIQREAEAERLAALERQQRERLEFEQTTVPRINLAALAFALVFGLGGVLVILTAYLTRGRKPPVGPVPETLTEPPDAAPAIAGTIIDGETHVRDLLSTLLDLARRGYLVMEEIKEGFNNKFVFKRTPKSGSDLNTFEREFLDSIFNYSNQQERTLESMRNSFYSYLPSLERALKKLMIEQGLIEPRWQGLRDQWARWGQPLLILGVLLLFAPDVIRGLRLFSLEDYMANVLRSFGAVAALNGGALLLFSRFTSNLALTRKGAEAAAKTNAFFKYLENLDKFGDVAKAAERFDEFLPYTVAFGLDQTWINRFREIPNQPVPQWYYPVYRGGVFAAGYRPNQPHPFSRAARRSDGTFDFGGLFGGTPNGTASSSSGSAPSAAPSLDDLSRGLSTGLNDISIGLSGMLNNTASAFISQPLPPPPASSSFLDGLFESEDSSGGGSSWSSSSRSRSSGYRSRPSGGWSSGGRSFSGGGSRRGGGSGRGRAGFR